MMNEEDKLKIKINKLKWEVEQMNQIFSTIILGLFLGIAIPTLITTEGMTKIYVAIIMFVVIVIGAGIYWAFQHNKYSKIDKEYGEILK